MAQLGGARRSGRRGRRFESCHSDFFMPISTFFLTICFYSEVNPQKHGKCRNQAIADIFQYMHIVEAWGTGIPRVITSCKQYGLQEPVFEEFGDGIKATVYRLQATKASDKRQKQAASGKNKRKRQNC